MLLARILHINILFFYEVSSIKIMQMKLWIFASGFLNYWSSNLYFKHTIPRGNRILHCNKVYVHRHGILCKISHMYPRGVEYTFRCLYIDSFNRINVRALLLLKTRTTIADFISANIVMLKIIA